MRITADIWLLESYALCAWYFWRIFQKTILTQNPDAQYVIISVNHSGGISISNEFFKKKRFVLKGGKSNNTHWIPFLHLWCCFNISCVLLIILEFEAVVAGMGVLSPVQIFSHIKWPWIQQPLSIPGHIHFFCTKTICTLTWNIISGESITDIYNLLK